MRTRISLVGLIGLSSGVFLLAASFGTATGVGTVDGAAQLDTAASLATDSWANDVSVLAADDAWAVGSISRELVLIQHWDGTSWTDVPAPSPGLEGNELLKVLALSPSDVWAIGSVNPATHEEGALVEHWDGTAWTLVSLPDEDFRPSGLSASGPGDIWLVGSKTHTPVVLHWDGTTWTGSQPADPELPPGYTLTTLGMGTVVAISPRNAWLVGKYTAMSEDGGTDVATFVERWNGRGWTNRDFPGHAGNLSGYEMSATGPKDISMVGNRLITSGQHTSYNPFTAHWNGHVWTLSWQYFPGRRGTSLSDVVAISRTDAWAVGYQGRQVLAEHWDGHAWTIDSSAEVRRKSLSAALIGVDALDSDHVFAVGWHYDRDPTSDVLNEAWDGTAWRLQR